MAHTCDPGSTNHSHPCRTSVKKKMPGRSHHVTVAGNEFLETAELRPRQKGPCLAQRREPQSPKPNCRDDRSSSGVIQNSVLGNVPSCVATSPSSLTIGEIL